MTSPYAFNAAALKEYFHSRLVLSPEGEREDTGVDLPLRSHVTLEGLLGHSSELPIPHLVLNWTKGVNIIQ